MGSTPEAKPLQEMHVRPNAVTDTLVFDGTNWDDFGRLVTLARLMQNFGPDSGDDRLCAWLGQRFTGPALDWLGAYILDNNATWDDDFLRFQTQVKEAFGISDDVLTNYHRAQFDALQWGQDAPLFFAEFDRLTTAMRFTADPIRIELLRAKLPSSLRMQLAEQALDFTSYSVYKQRLILMWALKPKGVAHTRAKDTTRPTCGKCGKKGHRAADCRSGK